MAIDELLVVETSQAQECVHAIITLNIEQVLYSSTLTVLVSFRNLEALEPVATSLLREEHHRVVHRCRIDVLREVLLAAVCALASHSASCLLAEFT